MNARFWAYINGGPVKITLRPGQTLSHYQAWATDEGWASEGDTWEHTGDGVEHEYASDGADCDGRLSSGGDSYCALCDLRAGNYPYITEGDDLEMWEDVRYPAWQDAGGYRRDYQAELAGY